MPRLPPGPRGRFLTGCLHDLQRDILGFLTGLVRDYGDVVGFRVLGQPFCMLGHPEHIEQVLVRESDKYVKSFDYRKLAWIVGRGLLTSEGETWRRQRALAQPVFHNDRVRAYVPLFVRHTEEMLGRWNGRAEVDVHEEMSRLALVIVAESLFQSVVGQDMATVGRALEVLSRAFMGFPFPFWLPFPRHVAAWRHLWRLDGVVRRLIRERLARDRERNRGSADGPAADLLTHLLAARDEAGRPMSGQQLRDELMTVFLAGHETTALGLSYALWLVARHPDVETRLLDEWDAVLGNRAVTAADVPRLEYTRAVLNEALRLYPPAWFIGREAAADVTIGGYDVRRGTTIFLVPYIVQRDARFFPEPERFDPQRWINDSALKPPRYAFFPFGAGPRSCIGAGFAMLEMAAVLSTILRRYRLTDRSGGGLTLLPAITLRPKGGMRMGVESRRTGV
jgi:cytochrome P450